MRQLFTWTVVVLGFAGLALSKPPVETSNTELLRLYNEDQNDRKGTIDWSKVTPRDRARESRVRALIKSDSLRTGADFYHAAMIFQHSPNASDYLLAHELCIIAISQGEKRAKWLSAASLDRYLMAKNLPQRWGTQYRGMNGSPIRLWKVEPGVTDKMRRMLEVPSLAEAKANEAKFNR